MSLLKVPVTAADHMRGNRQAPVTLLEYGDFECLHCGTAHGVLREVGAYFGDGMRFVFRHFPLVDQHPHADMAAEVAELAGAGGRFWEMHDLLFENQENLGRATLMALGIKLGLPALALRNAIENAPFEKKIRADFAGGMRSGVSTTPALFLNGRRYAGVLTRESLVRAIGREAEAA